MADNVPIKDGAAAAKSLAAKDMGGGVWMMRHIITLQGTEAVGGAGNVSAGVQRMTLAADDPLVAKMLNSGDNAPEFQKALRKTARTTRANVSASSSGDNAIVTATASQTTRVHRVFLIAAAPVSIKFRSGTTDLMSAVPLIANQGFVWNFEEEPWAVTAANAALNLNLSAAVAVTGFVDYVKSA